MFSPLLSICRPISPVLTWHSLIIHFALISQLTFLISTNVSATERGLHECLDMQNKGDKENALKCYEKEAQKPQLIKPRGTSLAAEWGPSESLLDIYKQNYFLFYSHSSQPNNSPTSLNPKNNVTNTYPLDNKEVKFQVSIKKNIVDYGRHTLWFGYTQLSFWQIYDHTNSRPFRENNYEPELIYSYRPDGWGATSIVNVGGVHQSNGQSLPRSRSWNRVYFQPGWDLCARDGKLGACEDGHDKYRLAILPRIWGRIKEDAADDDNSDITKYLGHGDIEIRYYQGDWMASAIAKRRSIQLDFAIPLSGLIPKINKLNAHLQIFNGYGESLIDYNQKHKTYGFGVSFPFK